MKTRKLIILGMAIVACVMASCKKDEVTPTNSVVIKASIESRREVGDDKTFIDTTDTNNPGKVVWSVGDQISIHNGTISKPFTLISGAGSNEGVFRSAEDYQLADNYLAAYPKSGQISFNENKVVFNLPATQTLGTAAGTFANGANPMVAWATDINDLNFKNACGGIGIRLKKAVEVEGVVTVSNVCITSHKQDDCLWGHLTVQMNNEGNISNTYMSNDGTKVINLSCSNLTLTTDETKRVFIILPEGTLSQGFNLKVTYQVDNVTAPIFEKEVPLMVGQEVTVARNTLKSLPVLTIGSSGSGSGTPPTVTTSTSVSNITSVSATCGGNVNTNGVSITGCGVSYSTNPNFEGLEGAHVPVPVSQINGNGDFTVNVSGLFGGTTYYVKAYASYDGRIVYGDRINFITQPPVSPTVSTSTVSNITATTATCGGNVTFNGGAIVTERGICWSTSSNPTVNNAYAISGNGTGSYTAEMTGLIGGTTYYVRAYATNAAGTGYGDEVSFTTLPDTPIVTTSAVSDITETTAMCGGVVTYDCGAEVTERGICWSTSPNPTISDSHASYETAGTGEFTVDITGLTGGTTYYVRAYATNTEGTGYGDEVSFTTNIRLVF